MAALQNLVLKLESMAVRRELMLKLNSSIVNVENARKRRGRTAFVSMRPYLDGLANMWRHPEHRLKKDDPKLYDLVGSLWSDFKEAVRYEFGSSGEWSKFSNKACRFKTRIGNMGAVYPHMRGIIVEAHERRGGLKALVVCFYIAPPSNFGAAADLLVMDSAAPMEEKPGKPLHAVYNIRYYGELFAGLERQLSRFEVPDLRHPELEKEQKEKNNSILNVAELVRSPLRLFKGG